ncbi:MAG TPA: hypothetical protein VD905_15195 [Flavobacteriales bacterium]|nr:hypothetical protein [Flavobacteriales bacterium]
MKKAVSFICCIAGVIMYSCKKDKAVPETSRGVDINAFYECNTAQQLDTAEMANKLLGKWKLILSACGECNDPGWYEPVKTVFVTFTSPNEFSVEENSTVISSGHWNLCMIDTNKWVLCSSSSLNYIAGYILFCDNRVLFYNSYIDGIDNLFEKLN